MKFLKRLDDNLLKILLTLFVFFIPLFMKFPFQNVNFTYISIRLDDFMSVFITGVFVLQVLRGKVSFRKLPFKIPFAVFWVAIMLAFLSGYFIMNSIEYASIGFLHAARRIQYMMLFFIAFSVIKTQRDFKYILFSLVGALLLADIYGLGQRLLSFPAISTMNPEFAKGRILYLTPEARLSSTFAGHYDLGAFLVFYFPLLWALFAHGKNIVLSNLEKTFVVIAAMFPIVLNAITLIFIAFNTNLLDSLQIALSSKLFVMMLLAAATTMIIYILAAGRYYKWIVMLTVALSIIVLLSTSSRSSSIAYFLSLGGFLLYFRKFRYFIFAIVLTLALSSFDTDLVKRWRQTIQFKEVVVNSKTGQEVVVQESRPDQLPAGTAFLNKKKVEESTGAAIVKQQLINKATMSAALDPATQSGSTNPQDYETYSAFAGDISITTRLQVSWPRAVKAFARNPLLGTGPSSITESTDGDYFRWIGEMGALGTASFMYILAIIMLHLYNQSRKLAETSQMLVVAVIFGTGGLLVNAALIDVFEASKVAYMFWLTLGLFVGLLQLEKKELEKL